jgi:Protein of unknown function (DUF1360)
LIPGWLALVVLALAACRLTRLLGWDDLPPILRARRWVTGTRPVRGSATARQVETTYTTRRQTLAHFLNCGFCLGFWVALAVYLLWLLAGAPEHRESWVWYLLVPFALGELVGLVSRVLDP